MSTNETGTLLSLLHCICDSVPVLPIQEYLKLPFKVGAQVVVFFMTLATYHCSEAVDGENEIFMGLCS